MTQALDGLTVVDVSDGIAGPMTTMLMSDYGAEVIKVEPPGGDPFRTAPGYLTWNRGKKSVVLDLKSDADGAKFDEIVRRADILLESFAPGTTARLGIAYDRLHELNPRLIYCSITGYGRQGAVSQRPAYDALVQARTGMQFEQPGWRPGPIFLHLPLPSLGGVLPGLLCNQRGIACAGSDREGPVGGDFTHARCAGLDHHAVEPD